MIGEIKKKFCKHCGNPFTPYMSTDRYCSPKCAMTGGIKKAAAKKTYFRAKTHREPYHRTAMKDAAKKRDNYNCQLAGRVEHTCDMRREAHHIIYLSEGGADALWNLITLCGYAHHQIAHANKRKWQPYLIALNNGKDFINVIPVSEQERSVQLKLTYYANEAVKSSEQSS